jgi:hypothetical protein
LLTSSGSSKGARKASCWGGIVSSKDDVVWSGLV